MGYCGIVLLAGEPQLTRPSVCPSYLQAAGPVPAGEGQLDQSGRRLCVHDQEGLSALQPFRRGCRDNNADYGERHEDH